ncbi:alpha-L-rhamnosidase C-terminal domain-containing protein [Umezawaea endophytica]|uniref:Discoidin domain-containing protein n=1 Tax=Umezawaea endophytica TaxID=1654476 RepID=A0A9X2VH27_9PSEU|nr:alpha-L-rhamnosidase C-terminal domain-containing protein [Umezawaea endophytica]MCS7476352.1 discoidin domain-containing protein [Umezawaea endophytica]
MSRRRDGGGAVGPLLHAVAAAVVAALCTVPTTAAADPLDRGRTSDNFAPASRTVTPVKVTRSSGTVADPGNVLRGRTTTLTGTGSSVTLDFGKEVGGTVSVRFPASAAPGGRLGLAFTESSQYIGLTSDASNGGSGPDGALTADVVPGSTWTTPKAKQRGGFRYLTLFVDSAGSIAIDRVSVDITFAPTMTDLRDYENHFRSSDPLLNKIWYAGAYTVQTNIIPPDTGRVWGPPGTGWDNGAVVGAGDTVLVDGAKRDRTVWPGDLGVSVPTEYASLGDLTPTRNALTTLYQHQTASGELPFAGPQVNFYGSDTYHLWTLVGTATYVQYTHDEAWLRDMWSDYRRGLDYSLAKIGPTGLLRVTGTNDWARGGQGGENIAANALMHQALLTGAELAEELDDPSSATAWRAKAATLKAAVNATLWDERAGLFRDNPTSALHPQDGNSLAVSFGLTDPARARRISASLTLNWNAYGATTPEKNSEIGTFPGSLEVQAHLNAGNATRALELIRREWGYMLNSPLGTGSTFWEGYLANGQFGYGGAYMSAAHGWATGPTSALTFSVLGIQPRTVGGGYLVKPQPGDLTSAEGNLKTPLGNIELAWSHDPRRGTFTGDLTAPAGAVDRVEVPTFGAKTQLRVNGRLVWNGTRGLAHDAHLEGDYVVLKGLPTRARFDSRSTGTVPSGLDVRVTSSDNTPVRAGEDHTIAVTVTASGTKALTGKVDATAPTGWTTTPAPFTLDPAKGITSTVVKVGVHAPTGPGGQPQIRLKATAGRLTAETTTPLTVFGLWPTGTTATASSEAAPNVFEGQPRTYYAANSIDRTPTTFWNDASPGQFPDTLTLTTPTPITLNGIGFQSIVDGVVTDFTIQTWDGTTWTTQSTTTGNTDLTRWLPFTQPVTTTQLRFTATASQPQNGNYTRVAELTP